MTAIGETLRRERLRRNLELEQISRELKIPPRILEAIESDEFNKLPGGVFAKSFVRQYARLLGLDEDEMAAEVQRIVEPAPEVPQESAQERLPLASIQVPRMQSWQSVGDGRRFGWSSALPALALLVAVMLVCSAAYTWWQWERRPGKSAPPAQTAHVQQPPPHVQQPAAPVSNAPPPSEPRPPENGPSEQPAVSPTPPVASPAEADRRASDASVPPAASPASGSAPLNPVAITPAPPGTQPAASDATPVHVEMSAEEPVWVRVRENGKFVFSGTIEANQSRTLDTAGVVEVLLGNAGGLNISLNGKPIGPVGPKGQVRTIQLSSGGFKIVPSKPVVSLDPL